MERQPLRHLDLAADQVDPGHHFGDGVLHLNTRVDLDEVPGAGVGVHQELHRAGVVIAGGAGERDCGLSQRCANGRIERHCGRHFHNLLMTPLDRAIALVEMQDLAVAIAQDLDFDVAGAAHEAFDEDRVVAESRGSFAASFFQQAGKIGRVLDDAHAASAAAESGFEYDRKADFAGDLLRLPEMADRLFGTRHYWNPGLLRQAARCGLVAQEFEKVRRRSDKCDASAFAGPRKRGVLRQEAVPGMNGVDALLLS